MKSGSKYLWLCIRDIEVNGDYFRRDDIYYEKDGMMTDGNNNLVEVGGVLVVGCCL